MLIKNWMKENNYETVADAVAATLENDEKVVFDKCYAKNIVSNR